MGINVDMEASDAQRYLATNRLPWTQLHSEGGLESELANQLGIVSLPVTLLIDKDGKVVKQTYSMAELNTELENLLK